MGQTSKLLKKLRGYDLDSEKTDSGWPSYKSSTVWVITEHRNPVYNVKLKSFRGKPYVEVRDKSYHLSHKKVAEAVEPYLSDYEKQALVEYQEQKEQERREREAEQEKSQ